MPWLATVIGVVILVLIGLLVRWLLRPPVGQGAPRPDGVAGDVAEPLSTRLVSMVRRQIVDAIPRPRQPLPPEPPPSNEG